MTAPERIWIDWKRANAADAAYDEPPQSEYQDCRDEYILHTRAALAASPLVQEIVAEAVQGQWVPTTDRLPEKPGIDSYEHVRCLIVVNGEIEIGMWNCEHLCWDDEEGDDYLYDPDTPTHWMPPPPRPGAIRARGEGQPQEKGE